jgi:hypothetical protein
MEIKKINCARSPRSKETGTVISNICSGSPGKNNIFKENLMYDTENHEPKKY